MKKLILHISPKAEEALNVHLLGVAVVASGAEMNCADEFAFEVAKALADKKHSELTIQTKEEEKK